MEALSLTQLEIALATRAQGGKVICQVRYHDRDHVFPADEISIPGILIDHLVVADDPSRNHRQCEAYDEGRVRVLQEGRFRKFVKKVEQVTFSAAQALSKGLGVRLVTERCVFELDAEGWTMIEIAPGIDLESEVLAHLDFRPRVSPDLREMERSCFVPGC